MRTANPELQNRRRSEIISAAEQCFLKRGFHQTSMQNIAAESLLSMGLLYRYFANKEAIIEAVAKRDQDESLAALANLPVTGDVIAAWVALLINGANAASSPDYAALASEILAEAFRSTKIREMVEANETAMATAIAAKLEEQQRGGEIQLSIPFEAAAQSLLLLFDGLTMRKTLTSRGRHHAVEKGLALMVGSVMSAVGS